MWVVALPYGTGMRLLEGLRSRAKDIGFERRAIIVREGKGSKDRMTMLPEHLLSPFRERCLKVRRLHDSDLTEGSGEIEMPFALAARYPKASRQWAWQFVFSGASRSTDSRTGVMR